MTKVKIVYASMTGNDEDMADILAEDFEDTGFEVDISEISQTEVEDFAAVDLCLVVSYTYSDGLEGNIPDEGLDFYHDLEDIDLTGKIFGVCGSGDTFYPDFCVAVDHFAQQLAQTGAVQGAPSLKVELAPSQDDIQKLDAFAQQLIDRIQG
ncbi:flavodoxin [Lactobacillus sp. DCY120]|uniref:Flavodoxin n=1 Tax=Bombilactobacillus apium TaxID=2675299 RepID=A0A850R451_9LACO|nr:flavodoxin [Bombilactobacillus apium]NVY96751.1 flavodoxin [Bombilactobacillus apium]